MAPTRDGIPSMDTACLEHGAATDSIRLLFAMEASPAASPASTASDDPTSVWTEVKVVDDITVFRGVVPGCDWNAVKATGIVPCSASFLAAKLLDEAEMPRFDKMVAHVSVLNTTRSGPSTTSVRHVQLKPVLVTKARDFVVATTTTTITPTEDTDTATIVIASQSTTWPGVATTHAYVRGINFLSGYILRPVVVMVGTEATSVGCQVTMIVHVDPGGLLPAMVVNLLAVDAPWKLLRRFRKLYAPQDTCATRHHRALTRAIASTTGQCMARPHSAPPPLARHSQSTSSSGASSDTEIADANEQFANESVAMLLAKAADPCVDTTWSHVKTTSTGIDVFRGAVHGSDWTAVKATAVVRCSATRLAAKLMDPAEMARFDDMTAACRVLEGSPGNLSTTSVRHITAKPVFPTAARDFVVTTTMQTRRGANGHDDNVVMIASRSMDHPAAPATAGYVRGHLHISGYILAPVASGDADACHVTMIAHMDLGGMLPAVVINLLLVEAPAKLLKKFRELYGSSGASVPLRSVVSDVALSPKQAVKAAVDSSSRSPKLAHVDAAVAPAVAAQLPTNYAAIADDNIHVLLANVSNTSNIAWTEVKHQDGVAVHRGVVPLSEWNAVKATSLVQCPAWFLADKLTNPAEMTTFDDMTAHCHVLEELPRRVSVRHIQAKPVFPTTAREFVVVTSLQELPDNPDRIVIASRSTTHPNAPETKQYVRGLNNISGYVIDRVADNSCRVTMMAHMDLGGMLPAVVINALAVDAPFKLLKRLRTLYELGTFPPRPGTISLAPQLPEVPALAPHQHFGPELLGPTRLPDRTTYEPKTKTARCHVCSKTMASFLKRHNCQICGYVVCGTCSTHRIHTNYWTTLRACDSCVTDRLHKRHQAKPSTAALTPATTSLPVEPSKAIQPASMLHYALDQWKHGHRLWSGAWLVGCLFLFLPVALGILSNAAIVDFAHIVKVYFDS